MTERRAVERSELQALSDAYGVSVQSLRYLINSGVRVDDLEDVLEVRGDLFIHHGARKASYPKMSAVARAYMAADGDLDILRMIADHARTSLQSVDWEVFPPMQKNVDRVSFILDQSTESLLSGNIQFLPSEPEDEVPLYPETPQERDILDRLGGRPLIAEPVSTTIFPPVPTVLRNVTNT